MQEERVECEEQVAELLARLRELEERRAGDLSRVASGLAHHINNVLTSIIGNLSMVQAMVPAEAGLLGRLEAAEASALQLQDLTDKLQLYARRMRLSPQWTAARSLVQEAAALVGSPVQERVEVGLFVHVDPVLASRVLQILLQNAVEYGEGTITVRARLEEIPASNPWGLPPGAGARFTVQDQGLGIPHVLQPAVFEPFYSSASRGRGLGLPVARAIVEQHRGRIFVEDIVGSGLGSGCAISFLLPEAERRLQARGAAARRVLVMDDEPALRDVLGEMVRLLGYEVEIASDGDDALACHRRYVQDGRPFDLVILDLSVPGGRGGADILPQLRGENPRLKAIVTSGYWAEASAATLGEQGFHGVLNKPFSLEEVRRTVSGVLKPEN